MRYQLILNQKEVPSQNCLPLWKRTLLYFVRMCNEVVSRANFTWDRVRLLLQKRLKYLFFILFIYATWCLIISPMYKTSSFSTSWNSMLFEKNNSTTRVLQDEFPYDVPDASKLKVDFLHMPAQNICHGLDMVALVTTSLKNYNQRNIIRNFWSKAKKTKLSVKPVFMLGSPKTNVDDTNDKISKEAEQHEDILQGSFIDGYWNLTVKMINGLRWCHQHCKGSNFVMFVDDDVSLILPKLISFVKRNPKPHDLIKCALETFPKNPPLRTGKWAVPRSRYSEAYYPPYCSGPCFIMSLDVASKLYEVSRTMVTNIGLTDITVTGLVRAKSGIPLSPDNDVLCEHLETSADIEARLQEAFNKQLNV